MMDKDNKGKGFHTTQRFKERSSKDWIGEFVDYKEIDLLRKFLSPSSKMMSRRRGGTNSQEQASLKRAIKRARYMALVPYAGS